MTDTDLIGNYDRAIRGIANKVAGGKIDMIDDLIQVGRITLLHTYPKSHKWCFLAKAVKNRMLSYKLEDTTVRIPTTSIYRHGLHSVSVEVPEDLSTRDKDTSAVPVISAMLEEIEAKVEALPPHEKRKAKRYLAYLETGKKRSDVTAGKCIVDGLITSLRKRYDSLGMASA